MRSAYEKSAREKKYSFDDILEMRQSKVKPLLDEVYEIISTLRSSKGSALGTAITYALNQKEKLYLLLNDPNVEMTNNLAERTVKPYVINRRNFLFRDTENRAAASAAVMSIIETAKRNKLDVYGYLLYLLTVLPEWGQNPTDEQLDSVMPWSFGLGRCLHIRSAWNNIGDSYIASADMEHSSGTWAKRKSEY